MAVCRQEPELTNGIGKADIQIITLEVRRLN